MLRIHTKNYPLFSRDDSKDSIKKADTIIRYGHHELGVDTTWIVNRREGKHVYYDQKNRWAYMIITRYNEKGDAIEIINYRSD